MEIDLGDVFRVLGKQVYISTVTIEDQSGEIAGLKEKVAELQAKLPKEDECEVATPRSDPDPSLDRGDEEQ